MGAQSFLILFHQCYFEANISKEQENTTVHGK